MREKLSLDEFLEMYKHDGMFAIATDKQTQAFVLAVENEDSHVITEYTHPACDEVPLDEYIDFMIKLRRLRYDYHKKEENA